jgi:DNA-binding transcriptional MerR regulator
MKDSVSIGDASRETDLSQKQLRTYEAKGYIEPPEKIRSWSFG